MASVPSSRDTVSGVGLGRPRGPADDLRLGSWPACRRTRRRRVVGNAVPGRRCGRPVVRRPGPHPDGTGAGRAGPPCRGSAAVGVHRGPQGRLPDRADLFRRVESARPRGLRGRRRGAEGRRQSTAVLGGLLGVASEIIALSLGSSPQSLHGGLVVLSGSYVAAGTDAERAGLVSAADALIAATNTVSWAGILTAAAILVLSADSWAEANSAGPSPLWGCSPAPLASSARRFGR